MATNTAVNFKRLLAAPLDADYQVADIAARNALTARYIGQDCYVLSEDKTYKLVGGVTNSNWVDVTDYYTKSETYTKAQIEALIAGVNNVNVITWQTAFFDRLGFAAVVSGTGATANIPQINEPIAYQPAQGLYLLRSGTTSTGTATIRRDSTNGVGYQYYLDNNYFRFDTWVRFSEIPTATKQFYYLKSFHSTTGPGSDNRIEIRMAWSTTTTPNKAVFSISTKAGVNPTFTAFADTDVPLFAPTANTWYKLSLEINKATNRYNLYINNILAAFLQNLDTNPTFGYYGMFIGLLNTSGNFATPVTCAVDHYKETVILAIPQIL
jgi:hypothetical protein